MQPLFFEQLAAPVPEPGAWAMLTAGLAWLSYLARKNPIRNGRKQTMRSPVNGRPYSVEAAGGPLTASAQVHVAGMVATVP
jgi:peptidoglycan/LPS O-acetylase OafA/YrhL